MLNTQSTSIIRLCLIMLSTLTLGISSSQNVFHEKIYTNDADFNDGTFDGVNCSEVSNQIQLDKVISNLPYAWIANADDGTVSKIDTKTGTEVARYRTGSKGSIEQPSRTAIALNGDCWLANRAFSSQGSVIKIVAEGGVDRNGNGIIETSTGPTDIKEWWQDEKVVLSVDVGGNNDVPRALAIDKHGFIWVGLYASKKYVVLDNEGTIIEEVPVDGNPYGATVDANGILWSANLMTGLDKIDTDPLNRSYVKSYVLGGSYGVVVDKNGIVWVGAFSNSVTGGVIRFDPVTETKIDCHAGGATFGRGVCVDKDGNIWAAMGYGNPNNLVAKFNSDGAFLNSFLVGTNPCGVSADNEGNIIVVCQGSNNVYKLRTDGFELWHVSVGTTPYTYGDFTGFVLKNITQKLGTWTVIHDGGMPDVPWGKITWNQEAEGRVPEGTSIAVQARCADAQEALSIQSWSDVANGESFEPMNGRFIEVKVQLSTTNEDSPILSDLKIESINRPPQAYALVNGQKSITVQQQTHIGTEVTLDGSLSTDPDNDILLYEWDFNNDGIADANEASVHHIFNLGGPYPVTLKVIDPFGASSTDQVTITVFDQIAPELTLSTSKTSLWPPNHEFIDVELNLSCQDICDPDPTVTLSVTQNEPLERTTENGDIAPDAILTIDANGNYSGLQIRSTRKGSGDGRVYLLIASATDEAGNVTKKCWAVTVPKSQSKKDVDSVAAKAAAAVAAGVSLEYNSLSGSSAGAM
ncbi:MAG: PKD domain-containing protein [Chitinivibrionales bacterium]|nr:PKD domain-containing protein [Chitinivibrionales bacterium]